MSVKDKRKGEWEARTLCDFGEQGRRDVIREHYSIDAAIRAFRGVSKIYTRFGRCWQEDREGVVVSDSSWEKAV